MRRRKIKKNKNNEQKQMMIYWLCKWAKENVCFEFNAFGKSWDSIYYVQNLSKKNKQLKKNTIFLKKTASSKYSVIGPKKIRDSCYV